MFSSILLGVMPILSKVLEAVVIKMLMKHVDKIAELEKQLLEEYAKALDDQDDLLIPYLENLLDVELKAFERQVQVGAKSAGIQ